MASLPTLTNMSPTHLCVLTQVLSRDYKNLCLENAKLRAKNKWYHDKFHNSLCDIKTEREINRSHEQKLTAVVRLCRDREAAFRELQQDLDDERIGNRLWERVANDAMCELENKTGKYVPSETRKKLERIATVTPKFLDGVKVADVMTIDPERLRYWDDEAVPVD